MQTAQRSKVPAHNLYMIHLDKWTYTKFALRDKDPWNSCKNICVHTFELQKLLLLKLGQTQQ